MKTLKFLCIKPDWFDETKPMTVFAARVLADSNSTVEVKWDTEIDSQKLRFIENETFKNWYVDRTILQQYEDRVGYHAIIFFYQPDYTLHNPSDYASMTYPLNGRIYMQIRTDAQPIETNIFHENLHAMAQNLLLKGEKVEDKRFTQDLQGIGSGLYLDEDFASLMPYIDIIVKPLPQDTYVSILLNLIKALKSLLSLIPSRRKTLKALMEAMARQEGFYDATVNKNVPQRNNNPLDLKYVGQALAIGKDELGFAIFPDAATGFLAAEKDLRWKQKNHPEWTLKDLIYVWSATDQEAYVENVTRWIEVLPDFPFRNFV